MIILQGEKCKFSVHYISFRQSNRNSKGSERKMENSGGEGGLAILEFGGQGGMSILEFPRARGG